MVDSTTSLSEEECRGKGTLLEPYGGPRFIITILLDVIYGLILVIDTIANMLGKPSVAMDSTLTYLIFVVNSGYFVSRTIEKYK